MVSGKHAARQGSQSVCITLPDQSRIGSAASHPPTPSPACHAGALARGDACLFLRFPAPDYREKIWDHAAGAVIVTESGGRISDGSGAPLDFGRGRWVRVLRPGFLFRPARARQKTSLTFACAHHVMVNARQWLVTRGSVM